MEKEVGGMDKYREDLPPTVAEAIDKELSAQTRHFFDKVVETDWKVTQNSFLVNAGGAVAVLAYWGSNPTSKFAIWPLILFLLGVIASFVEIRALLSASATLHKDALRRQEGFMSNNLRVKESLLAPGAGGCASWIKNWSGVVAQASFVLGVAVGLWQFFRIVL